MARDPDYGNRGHIDPGDPPRAEVGRYRDDLNCHNNDPFNRPMEFGPGSVASQREAHYAPRGTSLGRISQADMGPMPEKASPEREGPDYLKEADEAEDGIPTIHVQVGIPTRERTMRIMRGPATAALLELLRMQQAYQDTDEALGAQGQFAEIFHDTAKLKRMIWDRRNPQSVTVGEVQETLHSLVGHALLAAQLMEEGNKDGRG